MKKRCSYRSKGTRLRENLKYDFLRQNYEDEFVKRARARIQAARGREVRWYFAEQATANSAAEVFAKQKDFMAKIEIRVIEAIVK